MFGALRSKSLAGSRPRKTSRPLNMESLERRELMAVGVDLSAVVARDLEAAAPALISAGLVEPAVSLRKGKVTDGRISASGEVDTYTFRGAKGDKIELVVLNSSGDNEFWATAQLLATDRRTAIRPEGSSLDFFQSGANCVFKLPKSGDYTLLVRDDKWKNTGNYLIGFEGISPISPDPETLPKGSVVTQRINKRLEKDQFRFAGAKGERVELTVRNLSGKFDNGFWCTAQLFGPDGTVVHREGNQPDFFQNGQKAVFKLPKTGNYMLQVRDDNFRDSGSYTVLRKSAAAALSNNVALANSTAANRTVESAVSTILDSSFVPNGKRRDAVDSALLDWNGK